MVASLVSLVLLGYGLVLLTACLSVWGYIFRQWKAGQPILEQREAPPARWGLADVLGGTLLLIFVVTVLQVLFISLMGGRPGDLSIENRVAAIWGMAIGEIVVFIVMYLAIALRGGGQQMVGKTQGRFYDDVRVGVLAFCALCIPVLCIQVLAAYLVPYEHPLIDLLIESPQASILVPVVFSAVIVAPLFEEFAFRLVLQGWLEDWLGHRLHGPNEVLLGKLDTRPAAETFAIADEALTEEPLVETLPDPPEESGNPYVSPPLAEEAEPPRSELDDGYYGVEHAEPPWRVWLPTLVSASVFALLHFGQGAAPIPLFFLALGLGYVFHKTRTLTATVVVHFLLNGQSMLILLLQIFLGDSLPAEVP